MFRIEFQRLFVLREETFISPYSFHLYFCDKTLTTDPIWYIFLTYLIAYLPLCVFGVHQEKISVLEYFLKSQKRIFYYRSTNLAFCA